MNTTSESLMLQEMPGKYGIFFWEFHRFAFLIENETRYTRILLISIAMFGVAMCLVFAVILIITVRYRKSQKVIMKYFDLIR